MSCSGTPPRSSPTCSEPGLFTPSPGGVSTASPGGVFPINTKTEKHSENDCWRLLVTCLAADRVTGVCRSARAVQFGESLSGLVCLARYCPVPDEHVSGDAARGLTHLALTRSALTRSALPDRSTWSSTAEVRQQPKYANRRSLACSCLPACAGPTGRDGFIGPSRPAQRRSTYTDPPSLDRPRSDQRRPGRSSPPLARST